MFKVVVGHGLLAGPFDWVGALGPQRVGEECYVAPPLLRGWFPSPRLQARLKALPWAICPPRSVPGQGQGEGSSHFVFTPEGTDCLAWRLFCT